jgi:hypothetical protein
VASTAFQVFQGRIDNLLDQIWSDTNHNNVIDPYEPGLIPALLARGTAQDSAELNFSTNVTTVAKGVLFNAALAATEDRQNFLSGKVMGRGFATHMASGNGVHNPFLLEALLTSSIQALHTSYGLTPPAPVDLRVQATPPPGVRLAGAKLSSIREVGSR